MDTREVANNADGDEIAPSYYAQLREQLEATQRLHSAAMVDLDRLTKRITLLEGQLDDQRTWWPFDEAEVSRGWAVSPGEEEPSGFVAVFSDQAEAERYATWRQEQERAVDEDDRDPSWEYPNVLPSEFRVRIWNSFDPAPPPSLVAFRGLPGHWAPAPGASREEDAAVTTLICEPVAAAFAQHKEPDEAAALQRRLGQEDVLDAVCSQGYPHPGDEPIEAWADRVFDAERDCQSCDNLCEAQANIDMLVVQRNRAQHGEGLLRDRLAGALAELRQTLAEMATLQGLYADARDFIDQHWPDAADSRKPAGIG
jgi:hypothetical protein